MTFAAHFPGSHSIGASTYMRTTVHDCGIRARARLAVKARLRPARGFINTCKYIPCRECTIENGMGEEYGCLATYTPIASECSGGILALVLAVIFLEPECVGGERLSDMCNLPCTLSAGHCVSLPPFPPICRSRGGGGGRSFHSHSHAYCPNYVSKGKMIHVINSQ